MAAIHNVTIEQGAVFRLRLTWRDKRGKPVNLTGMALKLQARAHYGSDVLFELLTDAGIATIPLLGVIILELSKAATAALTFDTAVYDLMADDVRLLQGKCTLSKGVTDIPAP